MPVIRSRAAATICWRGWTEPATRFAVVVVVVVVMTLSDNTKSNQHTGSSDVSVQEKQFTITQCEHKQMQTDIEIESTLNAHFKLVPNVPMCLSFSKYNGKTTGLFTELLV